MDGQKDDDDDFFTFFSEIKMKKQNINRLLRRRKIQEYTGNLDSEFLIL